MAEKNGNKNLLLVDDDALILRSLARLFTSQGYETANFTDPLAAWNAFRRQKPSFDLVITDVLMPKLSGRELAEKIWSIRPEQKLIFLSSHTNGLIDHHECQKHGWVFLQKPADSTQLLAMVRSLLAD